jgi:hypothetical protein
MTDYNVDKLLFYMRKLDMGGIQATLFYYRTFVMFIYGDIFALKIESA